MKIIALEPNFVFHSVPFEKIVYDNRDHYQLFIELDDENEDRYEFEFIFPIALKMITEECVEYNEELLNSMPNYNYSIFEILDSDWISQFKDNSRYTDPSTRTYRHIMNDMHHYLVILRDFNIEIMAKGYKLEKLEK
jgi:hypothetical protein